MGILRNELKSNFTQVPNDLLFDKRVSFGARILFCYLASKPNNWKIINQNIITNLNISSDSVAKYFNELLETGWITREREINEKGQYCGGYNYTIYYEPKTPLLGENPNTEKVLIRKKSGNNNNIISINNIKTTNNMDIILAEEKTQKKFVPPTIEEITAYSKEIDAGIDAEQFFYWYEAKGWMIGKNKMKDWKAAVRTWKRKNSKENTANEFLELGRG